MILNSPTKENSSNIRRPLLLAVAILLLIGCGANRNSGQPNIYGERRSSSTDNSAETNGSTKGSVPATRISDTSAVAEPESDRLSGNTTNNNSQSKNNDGAGSSAWSYHTAESDETASAVDDEVWRQFELADEYHAMGVIANREASWEEAQYYFEKALSILAQLDIEADSVMSPEATRYTGLLDDIVSDYRVTLRSLGHLESNVSAAVLIERFGDLAQNLGLDTISLYPDGEAIQRQVSYDVPIVMNARVKKSIVYFQTVAKEAFKKYLRRSKKYTPMMKRILSEYGLPHDLIYLSLVESGYNPHAYSWARAMGLWQFISSTGRMYKLKRSWWYDERKDPVKSTHAAAQFLKDLYKEFGDWELAMAAYNGGPGRVRRTIKKQKTRDFWKLRLKRQTMDYVPLIMAATIIAKDPVKYGFDNIEFEPEIVWDEVIVNKCLELSVVAKAIGCSVSDLKTLNPELLRKYTPPNKKNYILKVPVGKKEKLLAAYDDLPSPKETSWVRHRIGRGETISTIAARYGVSQYAILEANNLRRRSTIYAGKTIIVPVPLDRGRKTRRVKNTDYTARNSIYAVRSGDTMWDIARAFGTSVDALRRINYISRGSRIYVGQKLKLPSSATRSGGKGSKVAVKKSSTSSRNSSKSAGTVASKGSTRKHKVRSGDTLWDIARKYGTTTGKIRRLNNLGRSTRIYPGQVLKVRVSSGVPNYVIHRVRRGETLGRIARRYGTTIAKILVANGKTNPDQLTVGEKLKISTK